MTIFDPIFTPSDAAYLKDHAEYVVLSVRIKGKGRRSPFDDLLKLVSNHGLCAFQAEPKNYAVDANTVVYMPHCDLSLFETFLRDNWAPEMIPNIVLVGNNLSDYADKCVSPSLP